MIFDFTQIQMNDFNHFVDDMINIKMKQTFAQQTKIFKQMIIIVFEIEFYRRMKFILQQIQFIEFAFVFFAFSTFAIIAFSTFAFSTLFAHIERERFTFLSTLF